MTPYRTWLPLLAVVALSACSSIEYGVKEKFNVYKSDILVADVGKARESQEDAREQFKDALEQFATVVNIEETGLKKAYDRLSGEYDDALEASEEVSEQIDEVENVADDLFAEWRSELPAIEDAALRADSERQLGVTRTRYRELLASMKDAEASMQPVLKTLRTNVLYLKHSLNAQAIGSLRGTFANLEADIDQLVERMNRSIERSNAFIAEMRSA